MTPVGHLAVGFATKRVVPKVPLGVLLSASWTLDILYFVFTLAGIESLENISKPGSVPCSWSHSLVMSVIWSVAVALLVSRIYCNYHTGTIVGLVVFSHWVLDLISWNHLPILFNGSLQIQGLGLFNSMGGGFFAVELGLFIPGVVLYIMYIIKKRSVGGKSNVSINSK